MGESMKMLLIVSILTLPKTSPANFAEAAPQPESWRVSVDDVVPPYTTITLNPKLEITNGADRWVLAVQRNAIMYQSTPGVWSGKTNKLAPRNKGKGKRGCPQVPEVSTAMLLYFGFLGVVWTRKKKRS